MLTLTSDSAAKQWILSWGVLCAVFTVALMSLPVTASLAQRAGSSDSISVETAVPNGSLVIVGGGARPWIQRRFVEMAGGPEASIACVPTAIRPRRLLGWCRKFFRRTDIPKENRTVIHTRDPETADTESFVEPLRAADGIWFTGGRQWRLARVYNGTKALEAFWDVLERGGVIGGSSAGASIQGSFLIRGDPQSKKIVVGEYTNGFGFLPASAIDQHLHARGREYDLIEVIENRPKLLGLGVDEGTAAIVRGDTLRVIGEGSVAIYDAQRWARAEGDLSKEEKVLFLKNGTLFDLRTRSVLSSGEETE